LIGFTEEDDKPIQIDPDLVDLAEPPQPAKAGKKAE
jgi:hypothetical protein